MSKYGMNYDELEAAAVGLKENMDKLRELKFHLNRAANIERFAISLAKFKVGDAAVIAHNMNFDNMPGWSSHKDVLACGKKVIIRDVSVDTHFEYGCQLEGRGPERSLFYMPGEWLEKSI